MGMDPEDGLALQSRIAYDAPKDGSNIALELLDALERHANKTLLVDSSTAKQWTGSQLLNDVVRIATGLVQHVKVRPNDVVMTICDHTGQEILAALGVVFAGGSLYGTTLKDGFEEIKTLCQLVHPNVIILSGRLHGTGLALKSSVEGLADTRIVWMDLPQSIEHTNCYSYEVPDANNNNENFGDGSIKQIEFMHYISAIKERDNVTLFQDLLNGPLDLELVRRIVKESIKAQNHILTYMLTSGSTGRPKVVPSTHEELLHGLYSMVSAARNSIKPIDYSKSNKLLPSCPDGNKTTTNGCCHLNTRSGDRSHSLPQGPLFPINSDSVLSGDLPLDHGAGLNTMFLALWLGAKYVVMPSFEVDTFWQAVHDHKITMSICSTTFAYKLFDRLKRSIEQQKSANKMSKWDLSSLKFITCVGAKLAFIDLVREVTKVHKNMKVVQSYGCTEIGFISMVHPDESHTEHLNSTGYLMPGLKAKIVERENEDQVRGLGERVNGELLVWSRSKFKGYRCHEDDDPRKLYAQCHDHDGIFYKTGDQASCDQDGRIHINGRFKDTLFLMEDWKILPVELEQLIDEHPLVEMSAVIGTPDRNLPGCHAPRAFVKLKSLESAELELVEPKLVTKLKATDYNYVSRHIFEFVAERTAKPKHLTGGVRIVDEFPRVGLLNKIDRKALRQMTD